MADGDEGTVQSMVDVTQGHLIDLEVMGPLGNRVMALYGILGGSTTNDLRFFLRHFYAPFSTPFVRVCSSYSLFEE